MPHAIHTTKHNHSSCITQALDKAAKHCSSAGLRFTPIRRKVFELVWTSHAPVAAYRLLKLLRHEKSNAEATTVYRALDFLLDHHLIHKIQSLNAYMGCEYPGVKHASQFLICTNCLQVAELENQKIIQAINTEAAVSNFNVEQQTIELTGICSLCQS